MLIIIEVNIKSWLYTSISPDIDKANTNINIKNCFPNKVNNLKTLVYL